MHSATFDETKESMTVRHGGGGVVIPAGFVARGA